jgi:Phage minor structural protein GP20
LKINRLITLLTEPIGYRRDGRPIYPVFGGAEDLEVETDGDDTEEEEEGTEDNESEEEPSGKKGKYTPPAQAEWLKVQSSLAKANASAKARRLELAEASKRIADLETKQTEAEAAEERKALRDSRKAGGKAKGDGGGVGADLPDGVLTRAQVRQATQQAAKDAEDRAAQKYQNMAKGAIVRGALVSEGVPASAANRLARLLDFNEIELDESGEVTGGLEEQLAQLKEEMPQLFTKPEIETPKPKRRPAPRVTPADQRETEQRPRSSAEQMAAMVLGNR